MSVGSQSATERLWFKSSYSGGNTTECVEAAFVPFGIRVRDSKQPGQRVLTVSAEAWTNFLVATSSTR
ncbi:DUF397 domain-containing protein [Streptomyces sp. NBC_00140]|uniref:DUF397 domain-containing protein n=1 Tax=Streptomyces sp. NBC_00140 TaxID=2975664 RepID=UPI00225B1191|nr:DUF397 domain-containing protein [Streptomyces sp. NBC_00140]MCX5333798.1 DUF397 domain-containing protein [Streptomyces sp. NBC_00140]